MDIPLKIYKTYCYRFLNIYIKSVNEQDTLSQEVKYFLTSIQCPFHRLCGCHNSGTENSLVLNKYS